MPIPEATLKILEGPRSRGEISTSPPVSGPHTAPELFLPRAAAVSATATKVPTFSFQILRYDLFINRIDPQKTTVFHKKPKKENLLTTTQNIHVFAVLEADTS